MVPTTLRTWFIIHFLVDIAVGIPLLLAPEPVAGLLGWTMVDPYTARLVGAALMGIGIESYIGRNAGPDVFRGMLNLKVIWSGAAIFAIALSLLTGERPWGAWLFLAVFILFNLIWVHYWRQLRAGGRHGQQA